MLGHSGLPEYWFDSGDLRSILCEATGSEWSALIKGFSESIMNRTVGGLPYAELNSDGSVSILLHKCENKDCPECIAGKPFEDKLNEDYIVGQLDYYREKAEYLLIDSTKKIVGKENYDPKIEMIRYRINVTPECLDSVLKLNHYYFYNSNEISILKLNKTFEISPGKIRLFPVAELGEGHYEMMSEGCQRTEMPSVQILHLLPNYDGTTRYFHWIPPEVNEALSLSSYDMMVIMETILKQQGMMDKTDRFSASGSVPLKEPTFSDSTSVVVRDMDPASKNFYLLYGNVGDEVLDHCKSVEVTTLLFYETARELIERKQSQGYLTEDKTRDALMVIDKMIATEKVRMVNPEIYESKEEMPKYSRMSIILSLRSVPPEKQLEFISEHNLKPETYGELGVTLSLLQREEDRYSILEKSKHLISKPAGLLTACQHLSPDHSTLFLKGAPLKCLRGIGDKDAELIAILNTLSGDGQLWLLNKKPNLVTFSNMDVIQKCLQPNFGDAATTIIRERAKPPSLSTEEELYELLPTLPAWQAVLVLEKNIILVEQENVDRLLSIVPREIKTEIEKFLVNEGLIPLKKVEIVKPYTFFYHEPPSKDDSDLVEEYKRKGPSLGGKETKE